MNEIMENPDRPARATSKAKVWRACLLTIAFFATFRTAVADHMYVPSGSMEPTLVAGDQIVLSKSTYGYSKWSAFFGAIPFMEGRFLGRVPERGDVIVFRYPRDTSQTFTKRVIGLPGDRVSMKNGRVILNGTLLPIRSFDGSVEAGQGVLTPGLWSEELPGGRRHPIQKIMVRAPLDDVREFLVPADSIFVMGDNRDNSLDSRVEAAMGGVGFVPLENLIGRVEAVALSVPRIERSFHKVH